MRTLFLLRQIRVSKKRRRILRKLLCICQRCNNIRIIYCLLCAIGAVDARKANSLSFLTLFIICMARAELPSDLPYVKVFLNFDLQLFA